MKKATCVGIGAALMLGAALAVTAGAGSRSGGSAEIVYESLSAGGAAFATNGYAKLGGSLGQSGFVRITTNAAGRTVLNGFWKAEDGCTLYNPEVVNMTRGAGGMGLTFLVVNSNDYTVAYVEQEAGGLMAGTHAITNPVAAFVGEGPAGSSTTIWHNVSTATNRARYYLIRCD